MRSELPVQVEISEVRSSKLGTLISAKLLENINANLQSNGTKISMPQPFLIRPGILYSINIKKFPNEHFSFSKDLKKEMQIDTDIKVKFGHDKLDSKGNAHGLISALEFNRI